MDAGPGTPLLELPFVELQLTGEGIFHARLRDAPGAGVDEVLDAIQPHLEAHAPVRYLIDASDAPDPSLPERWKLSRRMAANRHLIEKSAVVGLAGPRLFIFNVLVRASGRRNLRAFADAETAGRWLRGELGPAAPKSEAEPPSQT